MIKTQYSRYINKLSSVSGATPTIGPSDDHTDGTWTATTMIYPGEVFINQQDQKVYIGWELGATNGVKQIYPASGQSGSYWNLISGDPSITLQDLGGGSWNIGFTGTTTSTNDLLQITERNKAITFVTPFPVYGSPSLDVEIGQGVLTNVVFLRISSVVVDTTTLDVMTCETHTLIEQDNTGNYVVVYNNCTNDNLGTISLPTDFVVEVRINVLQIDLYYDTTIGITNNIKVYSRVEILKTF